MAEKLLEVKHLKKYFDTPRGKLHAVDDVSFSIEKGKTLGVVGESGCGKSTTGRCILRLIEPTSGEVIFNGQDITKLHPRDMKALRKDMQIIFQDPYASLDPRKTISQIISEPIIINKILTNKQDVEDRVHELMDTVGLAQRLVNTYPHELDGGRRQRIGIARSLAVKPRFVVCDEAVSALDVSIQSQILNLLMDLKQEEKLTYLFISHDLSVVKYISDRIGVMYLGNLVELAASKDLFQEPLHPYTEALLSAIPTTDPQTDRKVILLEGDIPSPVRPPSGCKFHTRCPYATAICKTDPPEFVEAKPGHYSACHHIDRVGEKSTRLSV